jgi:hypothetical protein
LFDILILESFFLRNLNYGGLGSYYVGYLLTSIIDFFYLY